MSHLIGFRVRFGQRRLRGKGTEVAEAAGLLVEMPEDLSRLIEVKDGLLAYCESLSPNHIAISRAIEMALRGAVASGPVTSRA